MNNRKQLEQELQSLIQQKESTEIELKETIKRRERNEQALEQQLNKLEKLVIDTQQARNDVEELETKIFDLEHQIEKLQISLSKLKERELSKSKSERLEKNLARVRRLIGELGGKEGKELEEDEEDLDEQEKSNEVKKLEEIAKTQEKKQVETTKPEPKITEKPTISEPSKPAAEGFKKFSYKNLEFDYPIEWKKARGDSQTSIFALAYNNASLDVSLETLEGNSLKAFLDQLISGMQETLNAEITSKDIEEDHAELMFSIMHGETKFLYRFKILLKEKQIYSLLLKAPASEYMNIRDISTHIFDSVKLI